jgi:small conductance mechanosensitive channel
VSPELTDAVTVWSLRVVYAAVILGAGLWFAFFISRFIRRQALKHPRIDTTLASFFAMILRYAIIASVVIAVLQKFGVQTTGLVAALGAGALAIGLALQGTLGNVASGIMIAFMRPYRIGDLVELNGREGEVINLDLFFTQLRATDGRRIYIPNSEAVSNPIVNYATRGVRRCVIVFGIGYEDDIDRAFAVLREVMGGDQRALADPPPWFGVESLGDFAVNISARVWVKSGDYLQYRADMLKAVKEAFDREGIEIPYPHTVEVSKGEPAVRQPLAKARLAAGRA